MPGRDMPDQMRQEPSQFGLTIGGFEHPATDIEIASRQGKGVDIIRIDDLDREWHSGVRVKGNILPDPIDILSDQLIID
jgi:hypothetical protein